MKTEVISIQESNGGKTVTYRCDFCKNIKTDRKSAFDRKKTHFCSTLCRGKYQLNGSKSELNSIYPPYNVRMNVKDKEGKTVFNFDVDYYPETEQTVFWALQDQLRQLGLD